MSDTDQVHRFQHEAMTTWFEILVRGVDQTYARQASGAAFAEVDRLESLLTRFDSGSDIARIALLVPGESIIVSADTAECLEIAAGVYRATNGAFDAAFRAPRLDGRSAMEMLDVSVGAGPPTVRLRADAPQELSGRMFLDLGALGKGYAVDMAADILRDWDIECALIHGGTSTALALCEGGCAAWPVGIGGDWGERSGFDRVMLRDVALSGSGTEVKGEHIANPRQPECGRTHEAAWALCPSAAESDAFSTAFMTMETIEVGDLCSRVPELLACVVPLGADNLVLFGDWSRYAG